MYRATRNRCALDITALSAEIKSDNILPLLRRAGFSLLEPNIEREARTCIGVSRYVCKARVADSPDIVDCSSFTKWLYGHCGVWIPRLAIQQWEHGNPVHTHELRSHDLVFTSGLNDYYSNDPREGVGHVGILTSERTIIHAASSKLGVIETPLSLFFKDRESRGARRYITNPRSTVTVEIPREYDVETSDDIKWILLRMM